MSKWLSRSGHSHPNGTMHVSGKDDEHSESGSAACRLAFHLNLGINLPDEATAGSSVWKVSLDTTSTGFRPISS